MKHAEQGLSMQNSRDTGSSLTSGDGDDGFPDGFVYQIRSYAT